MPWYYYHANHGGGHQGQTEEYIFHDEEIQPDASEDYWQDWAELQRINNARGTVTQVQHLPADVQQRLTRIWTNKRNHANTVLRRIAEMPTTKDPEPCPPQSP